MTIRGRENSTRAGVGRSTVENWAKCDAQKENKEARLLFLWLEKEMWSVR